MSGLETLRNSPPDADEIEVSLFGPGFGESLVIHLGGGQWITVDSCRDLGADCDNAALSYLEQLGVELATAVKLVVITHWHDDHIGGVAEIIDSCSGAKLVITSAFEKSEFLSAIAPWVADPEAEAKGLNELRRVGKRLRNLRPIVASSNKLLFERSSPFPCNIRSLSPSDASVLSCVARLTGLPKEDWSGRLPSVEGNDCSVVLSVQIGDRLILLGADLETRASRDHGWLAAVDMHVESERGRHSLFKISHHGSPNGDHPEIWEKLVTNAPYVILAPCVNGSVMLPQGADIKRILERTDNAWITASPKGGKLRNFDRAVQKQMVERARRVEEVPRGFGHIRIRGKIGTDPCEWSAERFGHAMKLSEAL